MAYAEQAVLLALPTEPHDQKLDFVVTSKESLIFDVRKINENIIYRRYCRAQGAMLSTNFLPGSKQLSPDVVIVNG